MDKLDLLKDYWAGYYKKFGYEHGPYHLEKLEDLMGIYDVNVPYGSEFLLDLGATRRPLILIR